RKPGHLGGRHATIDPGILQRTIETRDVLVELEELVSETAGDVVDAFAASEAAVEDRDPSLARRHEAAVDVAYSVFHRIHHPGAFAPVVRDFPDERRT